MVLLTLSASIQNPHVVFTETGMNGTTIAKKTIINTPTVWKDVVVRLEDEIEIITGGNLTIINSVINFADPEMELKLEDQGILHIKDSRLFGGKRIEGNSRGTLTLDNATLIGFSDDSVNLEGEYLVTVNNSLFQDNFGDAVQLTDTFLPANFTNSRFLNNEKDGLNMEAISLLYVDNCYFDGHGDECIQFDGPKDMIIKNTVVSRSTGGDGIKIRGAVESVVLMNVTVEKCTDDGIQFTQTTGNLEAWLEDIVVRDCREDAIEIDLMRDITIINANLTNSDIRGLEIRESGNMTLRNCVIASSEQDGIFTTNCSHLNLQDCAIINNGEAGFYGVNITEIQLKNCVIAHNIEGGLDFSNVERIKITQSQFTENTGLPEGANGITIENATHVQITDSLISQNSGDGITLAQTDDTLITQLAVTHNEQNGIMVVRNVHNLVLTNSTISANKGNGLFFGQEATEGVVQYNTITANRGYGIFLEANRTIDVVIDANYNFWGDDTGPAIELITDGGNQDEIWDDASALNATFVLNAMGEVSKYSKPLAIPTEVITVIATLALVGFAVIAYRVNQRRKWFNETDPRMALLMTSAGVPVIQKLFSESSEDVSLISGFISAINSFSSILTQRQDSEKVKEGKLEEIQHEEFTILLRRIEEWMIALVVGHSNPLIRKRVDRFSNELILFKDEFEDPSNIHRIPPEQEKKFGAIAEKHFADLVLPPR